MSLDSWLYFSSMTEKLKALVLLHFHIVKSRYVMSFYPASVGGVRCLGQTRYSPDIHPNQGPETLNPRDFNLFLCQPWSPLNSPPPTSITAVLYTSLKTPVVFEVAPSARVVAHLLGKNTLPKAFSMALVPVQVDKYPPYPPDKFKEPPPVVVTPSEGWPAPYYLEDGLRKVRPYHYTYNTSCKERWRGREILDVFGSEFRDREISYYVGLTGLNLQCFSYSDIKPRKMQLNGA